VGPLIVAFLPGGFSFALILAASMLALSALLLSKGAKDERPDAAVSRR